MNEPRSGQPEPWKSRKEIMEHYSYKSEQTFRRHIREGQFPPPGKKIGAKPKWKISECEAFLNGNQTTGTATTRTEETRHETKPDQESPVLNIINVTVQSPAEPADDRRRSSIRIPG